ncbi:anaphase-promoting complex subunit 5 isoform X2 [Plodia interpunctella]|uniref:anaphase-promoting complex subunit 5 isoform X2 n=1 Tax=Plodia interpunctella TaxID=58824 RepID=UPI002367949A|nr:anaphase-promoting complex subunit 5 isoform X2 [Plodia interpunctella]
MIWRVEKKHFQMDMLGDNLDFIKAGNAKGSIENITPHKIAVVAFIREYGLLKIEAKEMIDCTMAPKYRKDFCILALKLIQCPDMEFKELEALLKDGRYNLLSVHIQNFCVRLQNIYANGINALKDCVTSTIDKLMVEQSETNPCIITRYSVLGFYLRRIMLYLDKLSFSQVVSLYKSFCLYYQRGRPGLMMRSLSKEKLNNMEPQTSAPSTSPVLTEETKRQEFSMRMNVIDRDNFEEAQWSRKQAELFIAQQANLLQINEKKALPPKQLQKTIIQIMNDVPDLPEIHFLSFLNCIRMKEFCGAQDSLYHCFDRTVFSVTNSNNNPNNNVCNDRNKNIRYAALNRAAMHTQFGHKSVAMEAVREALAAAQEAADGGCLAHGAAWGALAGGRARRRALLAGAPRVPRQAAAAALLRAQHAAVNGATPADVFQIITKGDTINYLHSMTDMTMAGLANTAALWSLYGKTEMASVNCQLLLNLNTKSLSWSVGVGGGDGESEGEGGGAAWGWTAAACAAWWRSQPALAAALAQRRAPAAAERCHAQDALRAGKWEEADQSIKRLASLDRWESQLLKAEMFFLKGDATESLRSLHDVLDYCKSEDDSLHYISLRVRAMILMSQVQHTFSSIQSTNIMILNEALSLAKKYHLHYLAATVEMHIANVQLHTGCSKNALVLVRKVLPTIMAHGSTYDMARALLLYTKCLVSSAAAGGAARAHSLQASCAALDRVKLYFASVGAHDRLLHTWYLQAQLYHDIGNLAARNQCAWMYRQLETQNPVEPSNTLLIMY